MDISMDIHEKSVDMDMDMGGKFHIHGKPGNWWWVAAVSFSFVNAFNLTLPSVKREALPHFNRSRPDCPWEPARKIWKQ